MLFKVNRDDIIQNMVNVICHGLRDGESIRSIVVSRTMYTGERKETVFPVTENLKSVVYTFSIAFEAYRNLGLGTPAGNTIKNSFIRIRVRHYVPGFQFDNDGPGFFAYRDIMIARGFGGILETGSRCAINHERGNVVA